MQRDFNRLASVFCLLIEAAEKRQKKTAESSVASGQLALDSAAVTSQDQPSQPGKHTSGPGLGQVVRQ